MGLRIDDGREFSWWYREARSVRWLWGEDLIAGEHRIRWDGRDDTGYPLVRFEASAETQFQKMLLLR